jgi:ribosomal protein S18 acetylase RimI-like enzyme
MRGLRLFVRPIESADRAEVDAFLERHPPGTTPALGLLGKLLGEVVAVAALELTPGGLRLRNLVVAEHLRRKWIGRVMVREVGQFAEKLEQRSVVVEDAGSAAEFFRRVGFERDGERWVLRV